jgi:ABC-type siderophore export system fused ATPase/permease subunit
MMLPFLLNISLSRVTTFINYLSWSFVCASVVITMSVLSMTSEEEEEESTSFISYFVGIIIVSLMILICKRKSKAALIEVYHQVETMKVIHNKLSEDIMIIQKELKEQRHLLANTAHDLKMVSDDFCIFSFVALYSFILLFGSFFFNFKADCCDYQWL